MDDVVSFNGAFMCSGLRRSEEGGMDVRNIHVAAILPKAAIYEVALVVMVAATSGSPTARLRVVSRDPEGRDYATANDQHRFKKTGDTHSFVTMVTIPPIHAGVFTFEIWINESRAATLPFRVARANNGPVA